MRTLPITLVVLSAIAAGTAYGAPALSGTVVDGETLRPIAGATVTGPGGEPRAVTDEVGRFELALDVAGEIALRASAAGYATSEDTVFVEQGEQVVLVLLPEGALGETIEIVERAPRLPKTAGEKSVPREQLVVMPGARGDALSVVQSLPGVASAGVDGFSGEGFAIRGIDPEDSSYLIDGVWVPAVTHFGGLQAVVPSEFIDDIEFVPGGFGVEHGQSTGGIVQIHTRQSRSTKLTGFAELSFINLGAFLEGPLWKEQNVSFTLAFRRSLLDAVLPLMIPDDANVSFAVLPYYYDTQARLDWRPNGRHRVTLLGLGAYDRVMLTNDNENATDPGLTGTLDATQMFGRAMLTWSYETPKLQSRLLASALGGRADQDIGTDRYLEIDDNGALVREELTWRPERWISLHAGGQAALEDIYIDAVMPLPPQEGVPGDPNFTIDPVATFEGSIQDVWSAAWLATDIKPVRRLTVTPGIRLDYYDRLDAAELSPRLSAQYKIASGVTARGAVGRYVRGPTGAEYVAEGIDPETATHHVAGADVRLARGVTLSGTAYYTMLRDLVVRDDTRMVDDALQVYVNRGTGRTYGAELMLQVERDSLFGWISYTASRSERRDAPELVRRLFDGDQTHNLIAVASWRWRSWRFGGRWQYATGEPDTPVVGATYLSDYDVYKPMYGATNSSRLEAAHQLDLRIDRAWKFDDWALSAYLDVTNVYAHAKTLGYQYNFDYTEREAQTTPPILPAIGVRGEF